MTPTLFIPVLLLALTPDNLSPEAAALNAKAMQFYDAGQLAPAVDEFFAAYRALPDARRDRAGREQLLGSMRSTLLALHAETGEAAPLCRLRDVLQEHADALQRAWPEDPNMLEIRNVRARHGEVTRQLMAFGPDACAPVVPVATASAPVVVPVAKDAAPVVVPVAKDAALVVVPVAKDAAPVAAPAAPAGTTSAPVRDALARRQLVAGGVTLPLGIVALGVLAGVAVDFHRDIAAADALHAELTRRTSTADDLTRMRGLLGELRRERGAMIALGVTGAALLSAGAALLVRGTQRRRARLGLDLRGDRLGFTLAGEF